MDWGPEAMVENFGLVVLLSLALSDQPARPLLYLPTLFHKGYQIGELGQDWPECVVIT